jgi:hypothetical protein
MKTATGNEQFSTPCLELYSPINLEPCSTGDRLQSIASPFSVYKSMAIRPQANQILFAVVAQMAPRLDVMNLQVRPTPTALASPTITTQDLLSQ